MKKMIATLAASLALSSCEADDTGSVSIDENDRADAEDVATTLTTIIDFVGGEAASFVVGEIFALGLPEDDLATLSQESLQQIEAIVTDANRIAQLTTTDGEFIAAIRAFNRYDEAECPDGVTETGSCSLDEINKKKGNAETLIRETLRLQGIYKNWVVSNPGEIVSDRSWPVYLAPNFRVSITMDLVMLRTIFELDRMKGLPFNDDAKNGWTNLQTAAREYNEDLTRIAHKYAEIKGKFGTVRITDTGSGNTKVWKGCFDAPDGLACGMKEVTQTCQNNQGGGGCTDWDGPPEEEMEAEAQAILDARLAEFEALALGSEEKFVSLQKELEELANALAYEGECQPSVNFDAEVLLSGDELDDKCTELCEAKEGEFNGFWQTGDNDTTLCQCYFEC